MKVECPFPEFENAWIELPEIWLGKHAEKRDQAISASEKLNLGNTLTSFSVAMSLMDNWELPGLTGNPEKWDFSQLDLRLILWVIETVIGSFNKCYEISKK